LTVDMTPELVSRAGGVPWDCMAEESGPLKCVNNGRPACPILLMAGLHDLTHLKGLSDEQTVCGWVENPYWQFFCGEKFFQHALPIDPSQMTRWRLRIGENGVERLLQATLTAGRTTRTITESKPGQDHRRHHSAAQGGGAFHRLGLHRKLYRAMLKIAEQEGITLRLSYRKLMGRAFQKHGGYTLNRQLQRRSAGESEISHLKADGLLGGNFLKGMKGDAINAVLCGAGHNRRKVLARIRLLCLIWGPRKPTEVVQTLAASLARLVWPQSRQHLQAT